MRLQHAHRQEPEPDWAVILPVALAVVLFLWALLVGAFTIGTPA